MAKATLIGGNKWIRVTGSKQEMPKMPNVLFAKEDVKFQAACDKAGVKATSRQASKWRNKIGSAYANR